MKITALVEAMVAAGATPEMILVAVRATEQQMSDALEKRRQADADRQARKRERDTASRDITLRHRDRSLTGDRVTRVEDKSLTTEIEPQKKEEDALTREALAAYSSMAEVAGLAVPRLVTAARRSKLQAVVRQHGLPTFLEAVAKVGASSFCRGDNERGWKADLDFLLQAKSFTKILEGHYDDRRPRAGPARPETPADVASRLLSEMRSANGQPTTSDSRHPQALVAIPGGKHAGFG